MARIVAKQRKRAEINADAELIRECAREAVDGSGVRVKGDRVLSRNRQLSENIQFPCSLARQISIELTTQ